MAENDTRPEDLETKATPVAPRATPADGDLIEYRTTQVPNETRTGSQLTQEERDRADGYPGTTNVQAPYETPGTDTTASARKASQSQQGRRTQS